MTRDKTQVEVFIDRFGSMAKFSRAIGFKNVSTVQGWLKNGGLIPTKNHVQVYDGCKLHGIDVFPHDFLVVDELRPQIGGVAFKDLRLFEQMKDYFKGFDHKTIDKKLYPLIAEHLKKEAGDN